MFRQKRWEKREAIAKSRENREQKRFENMSLRRQCSVRDRISNNRNNIILIFIFKFLGLDSQLNF